MKKDIPIYDIAHLTKDDIVVSRFAPYLEIHPNLCLPHKHNFYHFLLFTKGGGSHMIDFRQFPVQPYQMYFMIPGQVHSWNFEGEVDGYVINFPVPLFKEFLLDPDYIEQLPYFSGVLENSVIILPPELRENVCAILENILKERAAENKQSLDMVKVLLMQLFITIGRLGFEHPTLQLTSHNYTLARNFLRLLEQHVGTLKLPKEYAELLFITPNHLNAVCKEILGRSAGDVIRHRVVLEAKRLMVNKELSISEIAYKLSFSDNAYFSKFFRKYAGVPPEDFRQSLT
ncbi:helix-turn-helix transcriptional regulator [Flavitalea sp. BT771]|uniref:helix-turn-helix domain-containing protein n=1 Tax=Flavitalea sp. BT771 TaxID=3063329 RepID=UPI0026E193BE|nr:helix-turn-helix transcriptional regulator [Flavitalea sp. BT771]MDO6430449.1 helix-turn-helix transcriptional regulator [Flavitalea sp. BT771]MDV6219411.1 helix-turn-helix transcriptional regulator [Flavitalea sp. BT771]